jgi:hypothetical protein
MQEDALVLRSAQGRDAETEVGQIAPQRQLHGPGHVILADLRDGLANRLTHSQHLQLFYYLAVSIFL